MTDFYTEAADDVLDMLAEDGMSVAITRETGTGYDPVTETETAIVQNGSLICVVLPASKGGVTMFDEHYRDNTLVQESLRYILAAAKNAPFVPQPGDKMTFEGAAWSVIGVTPVSPAGIPIIYRIGVKK